MSRTQLDALSSQLDAYTEEHRTQLDAFRQEQGRAEYLLAHHCTLFKAHLEDHQKKYLHDTLPILPNQVSMPPSQADSKRQVELESRLELRDKYIQQNQGTGFEFRSQAYVEHDIVLNTFARNKELLLENMELQSELESEIRERLKLEQLKGFQGQSIVNPAPAAAPAAALAAAPAADPWIHEGKSFDENAALAAAERQRQADLDRTQREFAEERAQWRAQEAVHVELALRDVNAELEEHQRTSILHLENIKHLENQHVILQFQEESAQEHLGQERTGREELSERLTMLSEHLDQERTGSARNEQRLSQVQSQNDELVRLLEEHKKTNSSAAPTWYSCSTNTLFSGSSPFATTSSPFATTSSPFATTSQDDSKLLEQLELAEKQAQEHIAKAAKRDETDAQLRKARSELEKKLLEAQQESERSNAEFLHTNESMRKLHGGDIQKLQADLEKVRAELRSTHEELVKERAELVKERAQTKCCCVIS